VYEDAWLESWSSEASDGVDPKSPREAAIPVPQLQGTDIRSRR